MVLYGREVSSPTVARTAAIVYKSLPHYRLAFYEQLRLRLDREGVKLRLLYGQPSPVEATKSDTVHVDWGEYIPSRFFSVNGRGLCWQPVVQHLRDVDLVIVEQASKLLVNPLLIAWRRIGGPKVAFWGHGQNLQKHDASVFGEAIKQWLSTRVDWWFAYTNGTADIVEQLGFPKDRITPVQNAIDTASIREFANQTSDQELEILRRHLGITAANVAVYIGGLYQDKRLDFLADALKEMRRLMEGFEAIIIGSGPERERIQSLASESPWVHYLGPLFGREKVQAAMLGQVMVMPGLVGLAIVDSFVFQLPLITTNIPYHSPEIEYLDNGSNGVMLPAEVTPQQYAAATVELLRDNERLASLQRGCAESAKRYTIEEMVERFAQGITEALETSRSTA